MASATLTSKGQVTIPVEVRKQLGLRAGSRVSFVETGTGRYEIFAQTGSIRDLEGVISAPGKPVNLEDMDDAIAAGAIASAS